MSELELAELISAPIIAVNDAEFANAEKFVELIQDFAFEKIQAESRATPETRLRKLNFVFDSQGPDGKISKVAVDIPLIQLMPISGVAVDTVTLKYALQVSSTSTKKQGDRQVFVGRLADKSEGGSKLSGNVEIEVNLKQVDMPVGALHLLQVSEAALNQNVQEPSREKLQPQLDVEPEHRPIPKDTLKDIGDDFVQLIDTKIEPREIVPEQRYGMKFQIHRADELEELTHKLKLNIGFEPNGFIELEGPNSYDVTNAQAFEFTFVTLPEFKALSPQTRLVARLEFCLLVEEKILKIITIRLPLGKKK